MTSPVSRALAAASLLLLPACHHRHRPAQVAAPPPATTAHLASPEPLLGPPEPTTALAPPTDDRHAPRDRAGRSATRPRAVRTPSGASAALLARIRACESGGNYRSVSRNGMYHGAYQASDSTWGGYGGYRHADQAPPDVQDRWASELYAARGAQPWPVCGR